MGVSCVIQSLTIPHLVHHFVEIIHKCCQLICTQADCYWSGTQTGPFRTPGTCNLESWIHNLYWELMDWVPGNIDKCIRKLFSPCRKFVLHKLASCRTIGIHSGKFYSNFMFIPVTGTLCIQSADFTIVTKRCPQKIANISGSICQISKIQLLACRTECPA